MDDNDRLWADTWLSFIGGQLFWIADIRLGAVIMWIVAGGLVLAGIITGIRNLRAKP